MKFSKTFTNKLVSYADRYFTYDTRSMKREGDKTEHDFLAVCRDGKHYTSVCVSRSKYGMYVAIRKDDEVIYGGKILKTYSEVVTFKKMIRCLG